MTRTTPASLWSCLIFTYFHLLRSIFCIHISQYYAEICTICDCAACVFIRMLELISVHLTAELLHVQLMLVLKFESNFDPGDMTRVHIVSASSSLVCRNNVDFCTSPQLL